MSKDFEEFQEVFKYYQQLLGLAGYMVYFKYEPTGGAFATIAVNQVGMIATVTLDSQPDKDTDAFKNIKRSAKHEALHLFLYRLEQRAVDRYTSDTAIYEASEEIVGKLEKLID